MAPRKEVRRFYTIVLQPHSHHHLPSTFNRFERLLPEVPNNEARASIDSDIAGIVSNMNEVIIAITEASTSLKSRRNNEAPINTLPEKLLTTIFDLACDSGFDHYCITRISWTCAMWREISLRTPSLWHCIDFSLSAISPRIAELFVVRKKDYPLNVKIHDPESSTSNGDERRNQYQTLLTQHIDTIQDLSIGCNLPNVWSLISSVGTLPTLLRSFSISTGQVPYSIRRDRRIVDILGECPQLREITLNGVILPANSVLYTHLETLSITLPLIEQDTLEIFSVLRRTTSLKSLSLRVEDGESIFTDGARARPTNSELVSLASLTQITLEIPSYDIIYVLSGLALGSSTRLSLKDTTASTKSEESGDLLPLDPRCLPCLMKTEKISIDREGLRISLYQPSGVAHIIEDVPFVEYSIGSLKKLTTAPITHLLLNLRDLKELVFIDSKEASSKCSAGDLLILLTIVPDLRFLQLEACSPRVCRPLEAQARNGRPRLCHILEILHLKNMELDEREVVSICASLAPHVRSVTIQGGKFSKPEEDVMDVLKAIREIDFQVISSQFYVGMFNVPSICHIDAIPHPLQIKIIAPPPVITQDKSSGREKEETRWGGGTKTSRPVVRNLGGRKSYY